MCVSEPIVAHEAARFVETVRLSMLVAMTLLRVMDHHPHNSLRRYCQLINSFIAKRDRPVLARAIGSNLIWIDDQPRIAHAKDDGDRRPSTRRRARRRTPKPCRRGGLCLAWRRRLPSEPRRCSSPSRHLRRKDPQGRRSRGSCNAPSCFVGRRGSALG